MRNLINYNRKKANLNVGKDFINQRIKLTYLHNTPFPHIVIPDAVKEKFLMSVSSKVDEFTPSVEKSFYGVARKFTKSRINLLPANTQKLIIRVLRIQKLTRNSLKKLKDIC
jgi:hypothetical protein